MNWVEGAVCIATIIGLCVIVDAVCATVRYWLGERPLRHGESLAQRRSRPGSNLPPTGDRPDPPASPPPVPCGEKPHINRACPPGPE